MSYFGPKVREMENELEQLRAQLIELTAENERLRGAVIYYLEVTGIQDDGECSNCGFSNSYNWGFTKRFEEALSQPTPIGLGAPVLKLVRAAVQWEKAYSDVRYMRGDYSGQALDIAEEKLVDAAQPFIENPELRKQLGVE